MNRYLELFRLENGIIGIIGVLVSAFIAVGTDFPNYWNYLLIACATIVCFIAGGNSINDYFDREIDKTSHPGRPIPSGRMKAETALRLGIVMLVLSCILSIFFFDLISTLIVVIAVILMVSYEVCLKRIGFVGNLTIAVLTGLVFILGGSITGNIERCLDVSIMAALVSVGREIAKDIEDMEGDKGRQTLPMSIGKRNASIIAALFYISGVCLSVAPIITGKFSIFYYSVFVADAIFIYAAIVVFNNPHRSQSIAKLAMVAALVAFVLGVIQ